MQRDTLREAAAEFLGTFTLIVFGVGVVAQVVLSKQSHGEYLSINLGWGLGVMAGILIAGGVSGAHLNPAVTLAMAVCRGFAWRKVVPFVVAQMAGAFVASAVVYFTYHDAIAHFDGGTREVTGPLATAGIWATYPQEFLPTFPGGFIDQVVGTALLVMVVFAIGDQRNMGIPSAAGPVFVGATVLAIGMTYGYNSGYAINPARDLAPRVFTAIAGWGPEVFTAGNHWWWVPVVAPCIGAVLGGCVYDLLIMRRHFNSVAP